MGNRSYIKSICAYCKNPFMARLDAVKVGQGKCCSKSCARSNRAGDIYKRFWLKIDKSGGQNACWPYTGFVNPATGYAQFCIKSKEYALAHRMAYKLTYSGPLQPKAVVMHSCDNRSCCNPNHLSVGTQKDNLTDMYSKNRGPSGYKKPKFTGSKNPTAKLTEQQVIEIRESDLSQRALAKKYSVARNCIREIIYRNTWKHI